MTKMIDYTQTTPPAHLESLTSPMGDVEEPSTRTLELPIPGWQRPAWATEVSADEDYTAWTRPTSEEGDVWTSTNQAALVSTNVGLAQVVVLAVDGEAGVIKADIEPVMVEIGPLRLPIPSARRLREALTELLDAYDETEGPRSDADVHLAVSAALETVAGSSAGTGL